MVRKILLAALIIISVSGVSELTASASTAEPTIQWFSPESATVASEVTIVGTNLADATSVTFNGTIATAIPDNATRIKAYVPAGATTGYIRVKTPGGNVRSAHIFTVLAPLDNAMSVVSDSDGYCALLTSSGVDCWGDGKYGQLGNGTFYTSSHEGSATPVAVEGVGGTGTLTGVASLVSDNDGYCAVLTSSGVDCWGNGHDGELGNGTFYSHSPYGSATPVAVEGVGGTGRLTGVTSLVGEHKSYCALLTSGGVDCWGYGEYGQLGNGTFYKSSPKGSATPVEVEGVGGTGTLTGVASLVGGLKSYCAVLTSSGVDCWGYGYFGELGNGTFYTRSPR
jgi:alpha-tubulin suppressor-like RCC1 family protein